MTPLMLAALTGCRETVTCLLIELRADPNILDSNGWPALCMALQSTDRVCIDQLGPVTTRGNKKSDVCICMPYLCQ